MSRCNRILHFEPIAVDFFFYNAEIGDSLVVLGCRGEKDTPEEQTGEKEFYHTIKISQLYGNSDIGLHCPGNDFYDFPVSSLTGLTVPE